jgi:integrase
MTGTATTNGTAPPDAEEAAGVHGSGKAALWAPGTTVAESRYDLYLREVEERRTAMRDDLQELLEAEQHVRDELEDALAASRDREKALVRALSALQDEPAAPAAPTKAKAKAKAKQQTTPLVSEDKVERVLQALVTLSGDGPVTRTQIVERTAIGHEAVRRALDLLREREAIRVAGRGRGGGILWAPMPVADDAPNA